MVQCEISVRWQLDEKACRSLVAILPNPNMLRCAAIRFGNRGHHACPAVWNALSLGPIVASAPSLARLEQLAITAIAASASSIFTSAPFRIAVIADSPLPDACKLR
jgi:hypothetical protein